MVPVTLGALLAPVQRKRSILEVPSATLCKMLQPVAPFPPLLHAGDQDLLFYVLHSFTAPTKRRRAVIPRSSAWQAGPRLPSLYAGVGHGLEGGEQEFTQLLGSPLGIKCSSGTGQARS